MYSFSVFQAHKACYFFEARNSYEQLAIRSCRPFLVFHLTTSITAEDSTDLLPQPRLLKGELFMDDKVENKAHAHPHKVAQRSGGAEFLSGEGNDHFFIAQDVHQEADGVVPPVNGDAPGNDNGKEVFYDLAGGFP